MIEMKTRARSMDGGGGAQNNIMLGLELGGDFMMMTDHLKFPQVKKKRSAYVDEEEKRKKTTSIM